MELKKAKDIFYKLQIEFAAHEQHNISLKEWRKNCLNIIKEVQKNAIEFTLKIATENATIRNIPGGLNPVVSEKSILNCKDNLFKLIDNE